MSAPGHYGNCEGVSPFSQAKSSPVELLHVFLCFPPREHAKGPCARARIHLRWLQKKKKCRSTRLALPSCSYLLRAFDQPCEYNKLGLPATGVPIFQGRDLWQVFLTIKPRPLFGIENTRIYENTFTCKCSSPATQRNRGRYKDCRLPYTGTQRERRQRGSRKRYGWYGGNSRRQSSDPQCSHDASRAPLEGAHYFPEWTSTKLALEVAYHYSVRQRPQASCHTAPDKFLINSLETCLWMANKHQTV